MFDGLTLFLVAQFCLLLGFAVGRSTAPKQSTEQTTSLKASFGRPLDIPTKLKAIKIDENKFVTKVADSSLIKKGGDLGKNSSVDDDISSSVNKLAQMKKNK